MIKGIRLFPWATSLLLCALAGAALAQTSPTPPASPPPPPRDAKNAAFWDRIDNPPPDALFPPLAWYRPLTPIAGTPGPFLPEAAPGQGTVPAASLAEAVRYAEATHSHVLIIVHKGVVQLERYFDGHTAESLISSHSMAKTLNAVAIGAAMGEGRIASLDQPAATWLPEWRDGKRDRITLRHLLTMSSGFKTPRSADLGSHYMQMHYGADVEDIVRDAYPVGQPDQEFAFDNDNSHAIGLVVERATGTPYADYISRALWKKMGGSDARNVVDHEKGRAYAYCCVLSTARDWVRIGQMLLQSGRWGNQQILPAGFVAQMRVPSVANKDFGLQVYLGAAWMNPKMNWFFASQQKTLEPALAPDLFYATGAGGQQMAVVPSDELVILRMGKASPEWRDQTLPNLLHRALKP